MQIRWKTILVWLAIEILLNFLGLDTLADYGEFVLNKDTTIMNSQVLT